MSAKRRDLDCSRGADVVYEDYDVCVGITDMYCAAMGI